MHKKLILFLFLSFLLVFTRPKFVSAITDPLLTPNNRFGIHILDEADLEDSANLVNSSGGDWGYITLVIRTDERDTKRWQKVFDKMRRLHLIPIVRIASKQQNGGWEKLLEGEIDGWVSFLNSLNWVVRNRYIIIGNEPNHSKEWGEEINPEEYTKHLETFSKKLKTASSDFFVLPAGLDASAANGRETMSEDQFLKRMLESNPNIFNHIDGWTSHSYPNPNFSGSNDAEGRGTVKTFEWELEYLKKLGLDKNLPVFITETGWAHNREGKDLGFEDTKKIANYLKGAYEIAWNDERVVAVTPFILRYLEPPYDVFSWKRDETTFYDFYYQIQALPKTKGRPGQLDSVNILTMPFPPIIPSRGKLVGLVYVKNTGQSIWTGDETITSSYLGFEVSLEPKILFSDIEPGEKSLAIIRIKLK